jgi:hypothetical protein
MLASVLWAPERGTPLNVDDLILIFYLYLTVRIGYLETPRFKKTFFESGSQDDEYYTRIDF